MTPTPFLLRPYLVIVATLLTGLCSTSAVADPWYAQPGIATTALGHRTAISCHNCYNGRGNAILESAAAQAQIRRAIARGADLIELDITDQETGGTISPICLSHEGTPCRSSEPWLDDILQLPELISSRAMLFLEVKSPDSSAEQFADRLFGALKQRGYGTFARPVFVRAFASKRAYLEAMREQLFTNPEFSALRHHIRFSLLFHTSSSRPWAGESSISALQDKLETAAIAGFDMVEFEYRTRDLLGAIGYARALGLRTGVYTIPATFGEAFIAALREEVDQITTDYRVDYARDVVEEVNTLAHFNSLSIRSDVVVQSYAYQSSSGLMLGSTGVALDRTPTSSLYGTPSAWYDDVGEDRFGFSLDFRSNEGNQHRAVSLGNRSEVSAGGFLVASYVNFDRLSSLPESTMAILNQSQSGGFALELHRRDGVTWLRFGVHVGGSYRYKEYNVANTGMSLVGSSLNGIDGYFLIGAYDGNGGVHLWLNHQSQGSVPQASGPVTATNVPVLIGADPQPGAPREARYFFDGFIQQGAVLAWGDHPQGDNNE